MGFARFVVQQSSKRAAAHSRRSFFAKRFSVLGGPKEPLRKGIIDYLSCLNGPLERCQPVCDGQG